MVNGASFQRHFLLVFFFLFKGLRDPIERRTGEPLKVLDLTFFTLMKKQQINNVQSPAIKHPSQGMFPPHVPTCPG